MRTIERESMALAAWSEHRDGVRRRDRRRHVRGLHVHTLVDGRVVGCVQDVLADERRVPRYLDLRLDAFDKHVLLPIGQARLDHRPGVVWIPGLAESAFRPIPAYDHRIGPGAVTRSDEVAIVAAYRAAYDGGEATPLPFTDRLEGPSSDADEKPTARIAPLHALHGWRIAREAHDPRGRAVVSADARRIGTVDELLIDTAAMKVRYFVCEIDEAGLGRDRRDRRLLVPTGLARTDPSRRTVILPTLRAPAGIERMPLYTGDELKRRIELDLDDTDTAPADAWDGLYARPRFDPDRFFGSAAR